MLENIWNKSGPITDPCGTPDFVSLEMEVTPFNITLVKGLRWLGKIHC